GAVLVDGRHVYHALPPRIEPSSTVGAGDSMLAGLVTALVRGEGPGEALRLGLACGSGTASRPGTELFEYSQVQELLGHVEVARVSDCIPVT
ncbi:MAG TPA: PfkB family carbohydrate kinase, partial [Mycobacterium sp.]|nr:PfkB family carbohydrate kinase [Mycobacterium sp.]